MQNVKIFFLLDFYGTQVGVQRHYGRAYRSYLHVECVQSDLKVGPDTLSRNVHNKSHHIALTIQKKNDAINNSAVEAKNLAQYTSFESRF
jgi:hypothetical protein